MVFATILIRVTNAYNYGDYFSKPNEEEIFDVVYALIHEANLEQYPAIYE